MVDSPIIDKSGRPYPKSEGQSRKSKSSKSRIGKAYEEEKNFLKKDVLNVHKIRRGYRRTKVFVGRKINLSKVILSSKALWFLVKLILLLIIPQIRMVVFLPYYIVIGLLDGAILPVLTFTGAVPMFIPIPFNIQGVIGWILTLAFLILYLFYFNPIKLVYNTKNGTLDITGLFVLFGSIIFSLLLQYGFGNFTITFFSFFSILLLYNFYQGLDPKNRPKALWVFGIILGIIMISIFFNKALIETGRLDSVTQPIFNKLGIDSSGKSFSEVWDLIFNPQKIKNIGGIEDNELEKRDIGIKITSLNAVTKTFNSGQPITIRGTVEAASLYSKDSRVSFECEMQDYGGGTDTINVNPTEATLPGNAIKLVQPISCIFEEGIVPKTNLETKEVKLISSFEDFYTESTYPVFTLDAKQYDQLYSEGKNPFDVYGWDKSLLSAGNLMNSKFSPGPVDLKIGSEIPQPFRAGDGNLFFEVLINPDNQVNLNNVRDFKLFIPTGVIRLDEGEHCDFEPKPKNGGSIYTIYGVKELDKIKSKGDEVSLGCFFGVERIFENKPFSQENIRVEMVYSFDITKKTSATIRKNSQ